MGTKTLTAPLYCCLIAALLAGIRSQPAQEVLGACDVATDTLSFDLWEIVSISTAPKKASVTVDLSNYEGDNDDKSWNQKALLFEVESMGEDGKKLHKFIMTPKRGVFKKEFDVTPDTAYQVNAQVATPFGVIQTHEVKFTTPNDFLNCFIKIEGSEIKPRSFDFTVKGCEAETDVSYELSIYNLDRRSDRQKLTADIKEADGAKELSFNLPEAAESLSFCSEYQFVLHAFKKVGNSQLQSFSVAMNANPKPDFLELDDAEIAVQVRNPENLLTADNLASGENSQAAYLVFDFKLKHAPKCHLFNLKAVVKVADQSPEVQHELHPVYMKSAVHGTGVLRDTAKIATLLEQSQGRMHVELCVCHKDVDTKDLAKCPVKIATINRPTPRSGPSNPLRMLTEIDIFGLWGKSIQFEMDICVKQGMYADLARIKGRDIGDHQGVVKQAKSIGLCRPKETRFVATTENERAPQTNAHHHRPSEYQLEISTVVDS